MGNRITDRTWTFALLAVLFLYIGYVVYRVYFNNPRDIEDKNIVTVQQAVRRIVTYLDTRPEVTLGTVEDLVELGVLGEADRVFFRKHEVVLFPVHANSPPETPMLMYRVAPHITVIFRRDGRGYTKEIQPPMSEGEVDSATGTKPE